MVNKTEFLECRGDSSVTSEYLLEYQRAILRALQKEKILTREQMEDCILLLEKQMH